MSTRHEKQQEASLQNLHSRSDAAHSPWKSLGMNPRGSLRFSTIPTRNTHPLHSLSSGRPIPTAQFATSREFIAVMKTAYLLTDQLTDSGSPPARNQYQTRAWSAAWRKATKHAVPITRVHPGERKSE